MLGAGAQKSNSGHTVTTHTLFLTISEGNQWENNFSSGWSFQKHCCQLPSIQQFLRVRHCSTVFVRVVKFNSKQKKREEERNWDSERLVDGEIEIWSWICPALKLLSFTPTASCLCGSPQSFKENVGFICDPLCVFYILAHHPGACQKCRVSGPNADLLNLNLLFSGTSGHIQVSEALP